MVADDTCSRSFSYSIPVTCIHRHRIRITIQEWEAGNIGTSRKCRRTPIIDGCTTSKATTQFNKTNFVQHQRRRN
ncbi:hypothetical protein ACHAXS_007347 [Conticribra weissflogii]